MKIRYIIGKCKAGYVLVAQSDKGVCAILLGDDTGLLVNELEEKFPHADRLVDKTMCVQLETIIRFVESPSRGCDVPLDIQGTAFQQRVWEALRKIPVGSTASYTDIARRIGAPRSARAVAGACAANKLAVAIPCHRIVKNDGGLSGYRWGIERKQSLLQIEAGLA